MSLNAHTAKALKKTRERMGVTAQALADGMGIALDTLYKLEGGRSNIHQRHIELASEPLGYTPLGLLRELARSEHE